MNTRAPAASLLSRPERRQMLRDSLALFSGAHVAAVGGALTSLVLRAAVAPALMGIWAAIRVCLEYGTYSSLGINRAAGLRIALARGEGNADQGRHAANVAVGIELATGLLMGLALAAAGLYQGWHGKWPWAVSLWLAGIIAVVGRYHGFCLTVLHAEKRFGVLARARAAGAFADLVCMGGGAWLFGLYGLVGGAVLAGLFHAGFVRWLGQMRFALRLDWPLCGRLFRTGWPMAGSALALAALRSVDRLVIVNGMSDGAEKLGWYSVAMLLAAWAFDQSSLMANVIYPRLGEAMGRTQDRGAVVRLGLRGAELVAWALVPCAALLLAIGVPAIGWLLPRYRPGLTAAAGLVVASLLQGISMPLRHALFAAGRTVPVVITTAAAAAMCLAGAVTVVRLTDNLGVVAWNSAAASAACLFGIMGLCAAGLPRFWAAAARLALAVGYLFGGCLLLGSAATAGLGTVLVAALWCLPPLALLAHKVGATTVAWPVLHTLWGAQGPAEAKTDLPGPPN